jgi:mRNA-degrading endonuclease RelE of RelBE toxin-antitoxin system
MLLPAERERVGRAIDRLAITPAPPGRRPLRGTSRLYREQCGGFRILYLIEGDEVIVVALGMGCRSLPARYAPPG